MILSEESSPDVAAFQGGFYAGGQRDFEAGMWRSVDGLAWSRVDVDPDFGAPGFNDLPTTVGAVASKSTQLVVLGIDQAQDTESGQRVWAWSSPVGAEWRQDVVEGSLDGHVLDATATLDGFLAVGPSGAPGCPSGIWEMTDGATWRCLAQAGAFEGFAPYAVASSPSADVVVGFTETNVDDEGGFDSVGTVWIRGRS